MTKDEELTMLKANIMGGMNEYVLSACEHQGILHVWKNDIFKEDGKPIETEEQLMRVAALDLPFLDIADGFAWACNRIAGITD